MYSPRMNTAALCEALAIKDGSNHFDRDEMPCLEDIMILCSSLVRKSVQEDCLEISHFTVEEFLRPIDPQRQHISQYRMDQEQAMTKLSIQRLKYLTWTDFSSGSAKSREEMVERRRQHPFRPFAVAALDFFPQH
ncbi:hypothetical protein IWX90DRAFT_97420 [Phyllosticta citrichinensis]|uniref:Uncharacterized protein n=1 Tax=Phyllosticta citrichinensis TaxID=1130410 RepID=A0ABR1Y1Y1_9PEZI